MHTKSQNPLILVLGGAGYIGSHMVLTLNDSGYESIVLDNLSTGHAHGVDKNKLIVGEMGDRNLLTHLFSTYPISAIIHFASKIEVQESIHYPLDYYQNNVSDTLTLLDVALKFGIKHFIFSSSASIYGNPVYLPIDENHPLKPINPYGRSKKIIEEVLQTLNVTENLRYVILRYFNVSGADFLQRTGEKHEPESHLIPLSLKAAMNNTTFNIYGDNHQTHDGTCIRDFIHVIDVCDAHLKALQYLFNGGNNLICNIGSGKGFTIKEVIKTVEAVTHKNIKIKILNSRDGDPSKLVADIKKANDVLHWQPKYNLQKIIFDAWRFLLAQKQSSKISKDIFTV